MAAQRDFVFLRMSKLQSYFFALCRPKFTELSQYVGQTVVCKAVFRFRFFSVVNVFFRSIRDRSLKLSEIAPKFDDVFTPKL